MYTLKKDTDYFENCRDISSGKIIWSGSEQSELKEKIRILN